jgi:hypothetical protein
VLFIELTEDLAPLKPNKVFNRGPSKARTEVEKNTYKSVNIKYGIANFPIGRENDSKRKYVFI